MPKYSLGITVSHRYHSFSIGVSEADSFAECYREIKNYLDKIQFTPMGLGLDVLNGKLEYVPED